MKKIFTKIIVLLCVVGFGMITSCKKGSNNGPVDVVDSLKLGLIAYYPFNDSGIDESGNGNNGMLYNISTTSDRNGKINFAYHFDGTTSYITVPDNQALRLSNTDFTLSAWLKLETQGGGIILAKRIQGDLTGWTWTIGNNQVYYGPGGSNNNAIPCTIATGLWYMVTYIYTVKNQSLSLYLNGAFIKTITGIASPSAAITSALYIGRDNPGSTSSYFFQGSMDDIRIYNRALTSAQIQKLYTLTY